MSAQCTHNLKKLFPEQHDSLPFQTSVEKNRTSGESLIEKRQKENAASNELLLRFHLVKSNSNESKNVNANRRCVQVVGRRYQAIFAVTVY